MLLPLLVNFWWCPFMVVDSWPCSYEQVAYSTASNHLTTPPTGWILKYRYDNPQIQRHPCPNYFTEGRPAVLYLGEQIFISDDNFDSSLLPLTIPQSFTTSPAIVSAAVFVRTTRIVLVINNEVFIYFYSTWKTWIRAKGITKPVTHLSDYDCCYLLMDPSCVRIGSHLLAYNSGNWASKTDIFYSEDGGYTFHTFAYRPLEDGIVLTIFNFAVYSEIGMLLKPANDSTITYFARGDPSFNANKKGAAFHLQYWTDYRVNSKVPPGMRGFVILWTTETFLSSPNDGQTTETITILPTKDYPETSLPQKENSVCFVATTNSEIAALTKTHLFYGSLDVLSIHMVHIGSKNISTLHDPCETMMFEGTGIISIIYPLQSTVSSFYHFHKCKINVHDRLMSLEPEVQPCPVEILSGDFHNKMYYIDIQQKLQFNATFVPKPGTDNHLIVTASNPELLVFEAHIVEGGYTLDGNSMYTLKLTLEEQKLEDKIHTSENPAFSNKVSTVTVDIYNKGIFCIDTHPLIAAIAVTCPPQKHIKILKSVTACSKGLFEPRLLQRSFYSIDKKMYDPAFLGRKDLNLEDLNVTYNYDEWGCPLLVYYDKPWLPVLELWDGDKFLEHVPADFVLFEIHGMHNYDYLLTELEANCLSKAQSWTMLLNDSKADPNFAWTNYVSCKKHRGNEYLASDSEKYQILNMNEENRILFSQYNGIYVFRVFVVDPLYSYCKFKTTFSVYVYGALPKSEINAGKALISFLVLIFGTIIMVYYFPKLLKENARMKSN